MMSEQLQIIKDEIDARRDSAGVKPDRFDVWAMRASNVPSTIPFPPGVYLNYVAAEGLSGYWVCPPEMRANRRLVYFHGGGLVSGGFHSHRAEVAWLAYYARVPILFVEYRLAPEHRFPAGLDDATRAINYASRLGPSGESSVADKIFVAGDSAGAGLAIAAVLRTQASSDIVVAGVAGLCGMFDFDETTSTFLQASQRTRDMCRAYVEFAKDLCDPLVSVIKADLGKLPRTLLHTGTADYCQEDSYAMHDRLKAFGVASRLRVWDDMIHVWHRYPTRLAQADEALKDVAEFLHE